MRRIQIEYDAISDIENEIYLNEIKLALCIAQSDVKCVRAEKWEDFIFYCFNGRFPK